MARLGIHLFGSFEVRLDAEPVTGFASDKVRALLAYLVVTAGRSHRRETLAGLLWPEYPERSARAALRNALANLRKAIGDRTASGDHDASPPFLEITRQTIQFNTQSDYWLDVTAFSDLLAAVDPTSEELEQAVALYQGPFLEGFSLADSAAFEEWLLMEREQRSRQVLEVLYCLVEIQEGSGAYEKALAHAWQQVDLEPWREEGQRQVMRLLALSGRRSEALAQYERCRRLLQVELGVEPAVETTALYEAIRSGEVTREAAPSFRRPAPIHNLPAQTTPFVGREEELQAIRARLHEPACRLLTLIGPGGVGKTRLALEAASSLVPRMEQDGFADGVFYVRMAPLESAEALVTAVVKALGFSFYSDAEGSAGPDPQQQLLDHLRQKRLLLLMDSFEHLLECVELVAAMLAAAPDVKVLATSRARLGLQGENLYTLTGMQFPDPVSAAAVEMPEEALAYSAVKLFVQTAQRVHPGFEPQPKEFAAIVRICHLVEGMPLGILLAAAWMTVLELDEIAAKIEQGLDFLKTDASDVPARQQSLRAVFDSSWSLLTEEERLAVQRLSVFRGGFDRAGAESAGRVPLNTLLALINKSWIQRETGGRFQIHEVLRQYGAERLARDPALEAAARNEHSRHYCEWLSRQEAGIKGAEQQAVWDAIQGDLENARAACMWAATQGRVRHLEQAINTLGLFYWRGYGNCQQGEVTFKGLGDALTAGEDWPSPATAGAQRTIARILMWKSSFSGLLGDDQRSRLLAQRSLGLLNTLPLAGQDTRSEQAYIAQQLGYAEYFSDAALAKRHFAQSHDLCRELGDRWGMAYALLGLGRAARNLGELEEAEDALTQSLSLHRDIGNQIGQSETMATLGQLVYRQSRFQEAEDLIQQSLSLMPETNRYGIAFGLGLLGWAKILTGQFDEAETCLTESLALFGDLGARVRVVKGSIMLAQAHLHAGEYGAARIQAEAAVTLAHEADYDWGVGYGKIVLGEVALVEGAFGQACQALQESLFILKEATDDPWNRNQSAWLGLAARGLERRLEAWQHLVSALEEASQGHQFMPLMVVLAGIALLLADDGEVERAIELYALASRHPFVANSRWFEDVVGREIATIAATLPPDVAQAAKARGQAKDLWPTAADLVEELSDLGQNRSPRPTTMSQQ